MLKPDNELHELSLRPVYDARRIAGAVTFLVGELRRTMNDNHFLWRRLRDADVSLTNAERIIIAHVQALSQIQIELMNQLSQLGEESAS